jgi:hypothetical protein
MCCADKLSKGHTAVVESGKNAISSHDVLLFTLVVLPLVVTDLFG